MLGIEIETAKLKEQITKGGYIVSFAVLENCSFYSLKPNFA